MWVYLGLLHAVASSGLFLVTSVSQGSPPWWATIPIPLSPRRLDCSEFYLISPSFSCYVLPSFPVDQSLWVCRCFEEECTRDFQLTSQCLPFLWFLVLRVLTALVALLSSNHSWKCRSLSFFFKHKRNICLLYQIK